MLHHRYPSDLPSHFLLAEHMLANAYHLLEHAQMTNFQYSSNSCHVLSLCVAAAHVSASRKGHVHGGAERLC